MMKRIVLAVAVVALGVTAVVAQSDLIATRKALMKENGRQSGIAHEMIEGKQPFDLAKAKAVLANPRPCDKEKNLWPDNSNLATPRARRRSGRTRRTSKPSSPSSAPTPRRRTPGVKDLDSFKAMGGVGKDCGGATTPIAKKPQRNPGPNPAVLIAGIKLQGSESHGRAPP